MPLLFRRPGVVPASKRIEDTVGTLDIAPTVLTAAGLAVPDFMEGVIERAMQGRVRRCGRRLSDSSPPGTRSSGAKLN